ncbi:MAG: hypothetical protein ACRDQY_21500, partial [Pseudonocardiaceae bacterium]
MVGGVDDLDGALLGASVSGLGADVADRDGGPVQGVEGGEERGGGGLDGHDVVRPEFLAEEGGVGADG